jgi:hypothetical protein
MSVIPELQRPRPEDHKFQVNLGDIARPHLIKNVGGVRVGAQVV